MAGASKGTEEVRVWAVSLLARREFLARILLASTPTFLFLGTSSSALAVSSVGNDGEIQRRLRFTLRVYNPSSQALQRQTFWCYLPLESSTQRLVDVTISMPYQLQADRFGHRILKLEFDDVHGFFQRQVTLEVRVACGQSLQREAEADPGEWLVAQRFIEIEEPRIKELADALHRQSVEATVNAVYDWVAANITYAGYVAEDLGALYALTHLRGDCTEYATLVVALLRANRIPARMIGGYVADRDVAPRPQDYHNWAEVFLHGRWQIVDAQKRNLFPAPGAYIAFRVHCDNPSSEIGNSHRFRMNGPLLVEF